MPDQRETRTVRNLQLVAAICLLLVVVVWFVTSRDFASLVALVTALGAVIALYRHRTKSTIDVFVVVILVVVTGVGLLAIFDQGDCINFREMLVTCEIESEHAAKLMYGEAASIDGAGNILTGGDENVAVVLSRPFVEAGIQKYVFFTQRLDGDSCFGCSPELDGMVLVGEGENWRVDALQKGIAQVGTIAIQPDVEVVNIGPGEEAFLFNFSGQNDGMRYENAVLIDQVVAQFQIVLNELIALNNSEICGDSSTVECWGYSSNLEFIRNAGQDFDDLQISTNGTIEMDDGSLVPFNQVRLYRFASEESQYLPVD